MTTGQRAPVVRIFNTVEPVISIFRLLGERLTADGIRTELVVTRAQYRQAGESLTDWARDRGIKIIAPPGIRTYPRSVTGKAWLALYYSLFAAGYACCGRGATLNVFLTQPPLFAALGRILLAVRHQPYVCVVMDLFPDILVAHGRLRHASVACRVLDRISRSALQHASAVVAIGRCMADRLIGKGVAADRIELIPNWPEPTLAAGGTQPAAAEGQRPALDALGLGGQRVLLYSGNLGVSHSFDEIIAAATELGTDDRIAFLVIGEGSRRNEIAHAVEARGLRNVRLLPYQAPDRAAALMREADAHLVSLRPGFEGLVVPSKAYSALASGRPLVYIGDPVGEIARMIREHDIGTVVEPGDAAALVRFCRFAADEPAALDAMGARARQMTANGNGRERAGARYAALIRRLT